MGWENGGVRDTWTQPPPRASESHVSVLGCFPLLSLPLPSSGVDFNLFNEGQIATCSWDETVRVFKYQQSWGKPARAPTAAASSSSVAPPASA